MDGRTPINVGDDAHPVLGEDGGAGGDEDMALVESLLASDGHDMGFEHHPGTPFDHTAANGDGDVDDRAHVVPLGGIPQQQQEQQEQQQQQQQQEQQEQQEQQQQQAPQQQTQGHVPVQVTGWKRLNAGDAADGQPPSKIPRVTAPTMLSVVTQNSTAAADVPAPTRVSASGSTTPPRAASVPAPTRVSASGSTTPPPAADATSDDDLGQELQAHQAKVREIKRKLALRQRAPLLLARETARKEAHEAGRQADEARREAQELNARVLKLSETLSQALQKQKQAKAQVQTLNEKIGRIEREHAQDSEWPGLPALDPAVNKTAPPPSAARRAPGSKEWAKIVADLAEVGNESGTSYVCLVHWNLSDVRKRFGFGLGDCRAKLTAILNTSQRFPTVTVPTKIKNYSIHGIGRIVASLWTNKNNTAFRTRWEEHTDVPNLVMYLAKEKEGEVTTICENLEVVEDRAVFVAVLLVVVREFVAAMRAHVGVIRDRDDREYFDDRVCMSEPWELREQLREFTPDK